MASLVPAVFSVLLSALYFIGADWTKDLEVARNGALLVLAVWMVLVALRKKPAAASSSQGLAATPNTTAGLNPGPAAATLAAPSAPLPKGRDVLSFLGLLQEKGRLLDFLMDDISRYGDAQVGAAARVVHQGAGAAVREYFDIKPVAAGTEGDTLTLGTDYDAHSYRLIGRVVGEPPYRGQVLHRGWLTTSIRLPELRSSSSSDASNQNIITPAEIELS
jgi:hypothetical protein